MAEEEAEGASGGGLGGVEGGFLVAIGGKPLLEGVPDEEGLGVERAAGDMGLGEALELVGLHGLELVGRGPAPFEEGLAVGETDAEVGGAMGGRVVVRGGAP